jgi:HD-GYP domain-containing protein (c-di-GMP phosphodiesterase class II)
MSATTSPATSVPPGERVPLSQVRDLIQMGQPLPFRVLDAQARLLLAQGQSVLTERQFEMLNERGAWVEGGQVQRVRGERAAAAAAGAGKVPSARHVTLFDRWEQQVWDYDALLRRVPKFRDLKPELEAFADACIALVDRDPDVALYLAVRRDDRRFALYALTHALHVATICLLTSRALGWPVERQRRIVGAALTMNVSMLELQAVLAEQADPPNTRQREAIRLHPKVSVDLLRGCGVDDAEWLDAVLMHHEEPGGGGYPNAVAEPTEAARLLRAADVYMAKISPRAVRAALAPQVAARQLYQSEQVDALGKTLAQALIRSIGIFPPGDLVTLKSGETAVVTRRAAQGPAPRAAAISDARGNPSLATTPRDTAQPEFGIAGPLDPAKAAALPKLQPERFYGIIPG